MENAKSVAVIVAHPDDETLWAGGTLLMHPSWKCFVACLCHGDDKDRAPKFAKVVKILKAEGAMGEIDDGPEQRPLDEKVFEETILKLLPTQHFDLIITHVVQGENQNGGIWPFICGLNIVALYLYAAKCVELKSTPFFDEMRENSR